MSSETETVAIALPGAPNDPCLWADIIKEDEKGLTFSVINGAWRGRLSKDGGLTVPENTDVQLQAVIAWRGKVPAEHSRDYNAALNWIKSEIQ